MATPTNNFNISNNQMINLTEARTQSPLKTESQKTIQWCIPQWHKFNPENVLIKNN